MVATASIKMDELLATWLGSDAIFENVMRIIETTKAESQQSQSASSNAATGVKDGRDGSRSPNETAFATAGGLEGGSLGGGNRPPLSPNLSNNKAAPPKKRLEIPPFFHRPNRNHQQSQNMEDEDNPQNPPPPPKRRQNSCFSEDQTWEGIYSNPSGNANNSGDGVAKVEGFSEEAKTHGETDRESVATDATVAGAATGQQPTPKKPCIAIQAQNLFLELGILPDIKLAVANDNQKKSTDSQPLPSLLAQHLHNDRYHLSESDLRYVQPDRFERITKELCNFPTFFHKPLYERILVLWESYVNSDEFERDCKYFHQWHPMAKYASETTPAACPIKLKGQRNLPPLPVVTYGMFHYYWNKEMAPYDMNERFFRLLKRPEKEYITRDDFFPFIKELLLDHPVRARFFDLVSFLILFRSSVSVALRKGVMRVWENKRNKTFWYSIFHHSSMKAWIDRYV